MGALHVARSQAPLLRPHMPELDGVRGAAVLAVLLYHGFAFGIPEGVAAYGLGPVFMLARGGWLGVHLFFVLSSFLITGILLDGRARGDYYSWFYARRARRILPAYLTLLAALWLLGEAGEGFLLVSVLFVANLSSLFGVAHDYDPLWSLAVEEQFYLLWPCAVRSLPRSALVALCVGVLVLAPVIRLSAFEQGDLRSLYYHSWFVLDGLAAGALLAIALRHPRSSRRLVSRIAGGTFAALLSLGGIALLTGTLTTRGVATTAADASIRLTWFALTAAAGLACVLVAGTGRSRALVRWRALEFVGYISYGVYLVQLLVFRLFDRVVSVPPNAGATYLLTRFLVVTAVTLAIATLSRWTLEAYFLSTTRSSRPAPTRSRAGLEDLDATSRA